MNVSVLHRPSRHHFNIFAVIGGFIKKNTVFCIALVLAAVTSVIVPPDAKYLSYFDLKTLCCLLCTLAVVDALRNISFFTVLAERIVMLCGNLRLAVLALVYITFIGSMLIANDMALITFLPLGYFVLKSTGNEKYMAFVFIMQNISANLGGMLTPFGNPQNLYLYSHFNIPTADFMSAMLLPFGVAVALITVCCLFLPREKVTILSPSQKTLPKARTVEYIILFALSIALVFRIIPYAVGTAVILVALLLLDKKAIADVDWGLLGTFAAFFVFSGNMARIPAIANLMSALLEKNTLLFSSVSCQFISNVPSAILLSEFTENWRSLLVGVNIGGTGTLIASLASLITFREYTSHAEGGAKKYIALFSAFNFGFLAVLLVVCSIAGY